MTAADKAKIDTEDKATSNQACEEDPGVEMLLMMRRRKGTDNVALPAPLSKAAIKTPGSSGIISGGLPSSHPYYRSQGSWLHHEGVPLSAESQALFTICSSPTQMVKSRDRHRHR